MLRAQCLYKNLLDWNGFCIFWNNSPRSFSNEWNLICKHQSHQCFNINFELQIYIYIIYWLAIWINLICCYKYPELHLATLIIIKIAFIWYFDRFNKVPTKLTKSNKFHQSQSTTFWSYTRASLCVHVKLIKQCTSLKPVECVYS